MNSSSKAWYRKNRFRNKFDTRHEIRHIAQITFEELVDSFVVNPFNTDQFFPSFDPAELKENHLWRRVASESRARKSALNTSPWPLTQDTNARTGSRR